jgi:HKD family nuclease
METPLLDIITQPEDAFRLGDYLISHLKHPEWTEFRAAIAFVKQSGVRHISNALAEFSCRARVRISVGIDLAGTSKEGLSGLLECLEGRGEAWIFHNENNSTFHPKVYLFKSEDKADLVVGSGNLTEGGLFTNYEASLLATLDLSLQTDRDLLAKVETALDRWSNPSEGIALPLTSELIEQLVDNGDVPTEKEAREIQEKVRQAKKLTDKKEQEPLFRRVAVQKAPVIAKQSEGASTAIREPSTGQHGSNVQLPIPTIGTALSAGAVHRGFLMVLQNTDVGVGQTTSGTSRRSPEIFIPVEAVRPVRARRVQVWDPEFWGWDYLFVDDPSWPQKKDRRLHLRFGTDALDAILWYNPDKKDYRLRNNTLRDAGNVGDIIQIEREETGSGYDYSVAILRQGTPAHSDALKLCINSPRNSQKQWGYY